MVSLKDLAEAGWDYMAKPWNLMQTSDYANGSEVVLAATDSTQMKLNPAQEESGWMSIIDLVKSCEM